MKQQYLGDSKDAFKWDYLDYLTKKLQSDYLDIIPMITPNDSTGEGKTLPYSFPASSPILRFCKDLRKDGIEFLSQLPEYIDGKYKIRLHKLECEFVNSENKRMEYFSDIPLEQGQIWFFDPDTGFAPQTAKAEHLKYSDIMNIWARFHEDAVIVVFQHAWRYYNLKPFGKLYQEIIESLTNLPVNCHATALYWSGRLMFVVIGKNKKRIEQVRTINECYKSQRPVELI